MPTLILANDQPMELETQAFTLLVHPDDINVEVPAFVEISAEDTLACVKDLNEIQWQHISTGELFRLCWYKIFFANERLRTSVPDSVPALHKSATGPRHIAGLIILACEAVFEGKNVFLRNPETFLHPATERYLVGGIRFLMAAASGSPAAITAYMGDRYSADEDENSDNPTDLTVKFKNEVSRMLDEIEGRKEPPPIY